jgi:2-keto-3-deoxy-L-fuconate dehydrogenase
VFAEQGATVLASPEALSEPEAAESVVRAAGDFDILVANLAYTAPSTPAVEVGEAEWRQVSAALVDPLPRLVRAAEPAMVRRRSGKILVIGSASALRGMKRAAARGAQLAYVQAIGVELAPHNVQATRSPRTSSTTRPTLLPRSKKTRASRSGWLARFRWAGW